MGHPRVTLISIKPKATMKKAAAKEPTRPVWFYLVDMVKVLTTCLFIMFICYITLKFGSHP
jgi:hypothetical protein